MRLHHCTPHDRIYERAHGYAVSRARSVRSAVSNMAFVGVWLGQALYVVCFHGDAEHDYLHFCVFFRALALA